MAKCYCPLTPETGVRFPLGLLIFKRLQHPQKIVSIKMNRDQFWKVLFFFVTLSFFITTLFHKSPQPWLFGRYSLPYFVLLLFIFASILFILFIYFWFQKKAPLIYAGIVIGTCSFALLIEIVGQIYVSFRPSYDVLRYVPEKIIGWKLAPNLNFISTDEYWYVREYSVPIKINSLFSKRLGI